MAGEPRHLPSLIRWFREAAADDLPASASVGRFAFQHGQIDHMGAPEWNGAFRAWLIAHPAATDREGHVRSPFRFWLWVMAGEGRQGRVAATFLHRLAVLDGDWLAAVRTITPLTADGEVVARIYATETLKQFWRLMATEPRRREHTPKSEAQVTAEEAA